MIVVYCNQCGKEVLKTRELPPKIWHWLIDDKIFGQDYYVDWRNKDEYSVCKQCRMENKKKYELGLPLPEPNAMPEGTPPLDYWINNHDESHLFVPKEDSDYYGCDDGGIDHWGGAGPDCSSMGLVTPNNYPV
jgi:hypothetical protein